MPTKEVFWNQIGTFNNSVLYLHVAWIILSATIICVHFSSNNKVTNVTLNSFLSLTFLFNGIFYFVIGSDSPLSRYLYGGLFLAVGVSLFVDLLRGSIQFRYPDSTPFRVLTIVGLGLVYTYPFVGVLLGRSFPFICMPMNPCPSTVMAIVLVTAAIPRTSKISLALLVPWGLLGLPKALGMFGCYEDSILFLAGLYGLTVLILYWKKTGHRTIVA